MTHEHPTPTAPARASTPGREVGASNSRSGVKSETGRLADLLPWRGWFIGIDRHGVVEFHTCVACGRPLDLPRSRAAGYGPVCERRLTDDRLDELVEAARQSDRNALRGWALLKGVVLR